LDVAKASDTIDWESLYATASNGGATRFPGYLRGLYSSGRTRLEWRGETREIDVRRGVRKGDPLSPLLFNAVMDEVLGSIPEEVGFDLGGQRVNEWAFADDLVLISGTRAGLRTSLALVEGEASKHGLLLNAKKSRTLSALLCVEQVPGGKGKRSPTTPSLP
jgi:hypothetical protein